jgi:hypothetical protein
VSQRAVRQLVRAGVPVWRIVVLAVVTAAVAGCGILPTAGPLLHPHQTVGGGGAAAARPHNRHLVRHGALCAWHSWRLVEDARHGSTLWATFQAWRTAHHCGALIP